MKITFVRETNIRLTAGTEFPAIGSFHPGTIIEVEDEAVSGIPIDNNSLWYKTKGGLYVWSGGTQSATKFDWNRLILNVPNEWRATEGAGVKIAILDNGLEVNNPNFSHLSWSSRLFDATKDGDDLSGIATDSGGHGTAIASILAASSGQMKGVAPQAEIYFIKIFDESSYRLSVIKSAIQKAKELGVDIIVTGIGKDLSNQERRDLEAEIGMAIPPLFCPLENTASSIEALGFAKFPNVLNNAIKVGSISEQLVNGQGIKKRAEIDYLFPARVGAWSTVGGGVQNEAILSSFSTATLAGIAALYLSQKKTAEGAAYNPPTTAELKAALDGICVDYSGATFSSNRYEFLRLTK